MVIEPEHRSETDPHPLVSVVVPARDAESTIGVQLEALARQDFAGTWEVVIADNGSTDATVAVAERYRQHLPQLRIVSADDGVGINRARNTGVRASWGQLVLFCDADDEVAPSWVREMAEALADHDAVGGIVDLRPLNVDISTAPAAAITMGRRRKPLPPSLEFLPYPVGANCAVRREVWEALGGFDEDFTYGGDEVEFFWRLQLAGYQLGFTGAARVNYRLPVSSGAALRRAFAKGRATAVLYRRFAPLGARFRPLVALRSWVGLLARSYRLVGSARERRGWLVRAAQQLGRAVGGLQQRRVFF